ncbi:MAG: hypothetical protein RSC06_14040, partial [Clostridia bacterium]
SFLNLPHLPSLVKNKSNCTANFYINKVPPETSTGLAIPFPDSVVKRPIDCVGMGRRRVKDSQGLSVFFPKSQGVTRYNQTQYVCTMTILPDKSPKTVRITPPAYIY